MGFGKTEKETSREKAVAALEEFLRPEFIARVDEIVAFAPLNKESLTKIAALMLSDLKNVIEEKGINLNFDEKACELLAAQSDGAKSGARELRNRIRRTVEDRVVDIIIDNAERNIKTIVVTAENEEIKISQN